MSPGWQSRARQRASRVVKRMARALPVLSIERFAGVMPTFAASDFCGQLAGGHLAAGEHYVYVYDYCHGICFLDSQLVLLTDSHGDSVDEGECQEYQRKKQVGIVDSEQSFGMEHDADIGVTDVVDEIDG